jgi:very-short-patch-repair endonuclease
MSWTTNRARELRRNMTEAERRLWRHLRHRQLGFQFRRQAPVGKFITDFVCFEARLIIEIDGGQHLASDRDRQRDDWLHKHGFTVLRFWNHQVLGETDAVVEVVRQHLPPPQPSPIKGEGE